jgi:hypothetical protein
VTHHERAEAIVRGNLGLTGLSLHEASAEADRLQAAIAQALAEAEARGAEHQAEREMRRLNDGY